MSSGWRETFMATNIAAGFDLVEHYHDDQDGQIVAMLYKESEKKWHVSGHPQRRQRDDFHRTGRTSHHRQERVGSLKRRSDGTYEFAYLPEGSNLPQIVRARTGERWHRRLGIGGIDERSRTPESALRFSEDLPTRLRLRPLSIGLRGCDIPETSGYYGTTSFDGEGDPHLTIAPGIGLACKTRVIRKDSRLSQFTYEGGTWVERRLASCSPRFYRICQISNEANAAWRMTSTASLPANPCFAFSVYMGADPC